MKIHHIGYAVKDMSLALKEFKNLGYLEEGEEIIDKKRNVLIQFIRNDFQLLELIAPLNDKAPVHNLLKKQGNTPYHICYETKDINRQISILAKDGYKLIEKVGPAKAINNKKVAFLFQKNIGIIELVENINN